MASTLTRLHQDHVWTRGSSIDDTLTPTNHDSTAVTLEDTINYIASQIADITGETAWETAPDLSVATMAAKTWLSDVRRIRSRLLLHDITVPSEAFAGGSITCVTGPELVDDEYFVLNDGVNPAVTFEFDNDASVTPSSTLRAIVFVGTETADDVKTLIINAVNGAPTLAITASSGGTGIVTLTNDTSGAFANIAITHTLSDGDWVVSGMTGGAGDLVVLSVAGSDVPATRNISLTTGSSGIVAAQLAGLVGKADLTEVGGDNALAPTNICIIVDADTGDPITSSARKVYALMQAESTASDGSAPDDSTNQLQLTFVRPNSTYDDLELAPAADLAGKKILYSYGDREYLHLWSQSDFRRDTVLVDLSASAISVTLDTAYDGGSLVNVDNTNVDWRVSDTKHFYVSDSTGSDRIIDAAPASGGDILSVKALGGINLVGDVNGSTYDATWNGVQIGGTANYVSTASGNLTLSAAADLRFVTSRQAALPLDDATAGPISALAGQTFTSVSAAIKYAIEHGKFDLGVTILSSSYARDANIPGGAGGLNISSAAGHSIDMNTPSGVDTLIFWNGRLMLGGNATDNNDVYEGTTPASGDIKVDHPAGARIGDVFIAVQFATA